MNNIEELLIANAELAAELLQHMADNEIDSDYFAVVTDSPNRGREVQSEHSVTEVALMAAGIIEQLIAQLEAAQKLKGEQVPVDSDSFSLIEAACEQWKLVSIEANKKVAALGDENRKLRTEIAKINAD